MLRYQQGKFILFDNNSKFGTLVSLNGDIEVQRDKLGFQAGRTLITVSTKVNKQSRQSEESEKIEEIAPNATLKPVSYIRRTGHHSKSRCLGKRVQDVVKFQLKNKSDRTESETIEDLSPAKFSELNRRSKKIAKRRN